MAYDAATLQQKAVFNSAPQNQPNDPVNGPADHGGGASFWGGGAAPSVDDQGNIYIVGADGSFNLDQGGQNAGDSVLKLQLNGNKFTLVDWFSPSNQACLDAADLEIGSGGVALLPASEVGDGKELAAVINKEGRLYLLDRDTLGHFNPTGTAICISLPPTALCASTGFRPAAQPWAARPLRSPRMFSARAAEIQLSPRMARKTQSCGPMKKVDRAVPAFSTHTTPTLLHVKSGTAT
jgi:hypothetical protein